MGSPASLIVRVAGLPATSLDGFGAEPLHVALERVQAAESHEAQARTELVEAVFVRLPNAPAALRGALLRLKRDAYNGRPLARHADHARWSAARALLGAVADQALEGEQVRLEATETFEEAFRRAVETELDRVRETVRDPALLRGLALASPEVLRALPRLAGAGAAPTKRQRRLVISLLRYVSRAAVKLSPYSTLTQVGLLSVDEGEGDGFAWQGGAAAWETSSLVRFRRSLTSRLAELALHDPARADRLRLRGNPTVAATAEGDARWLRPARWTTADDGRPRLIPLDLARGAVPEAVLDWLTALGDAPRSLRALTAALATFLDMPDDDRRVGGWLERLRALGVLLIDPPWDSQTARLELELVRWLEEAPVTDTAERPGPDRAALRDLTSALTDFPNATDPAATLADARAAFARVAEPLAGRSTIDRPVPSAAAGPAIFEDCFVADADKVGLRPVAAARRSALQAAYDDVEPWYRLLQATSPRLDFRAALAAHMARAWPDRNEVDVITLFASARSLWRAFERYRRDPAAREGGPFDPDGDASIVALDRRRREALASVASHLEARADGAWLDSAAVASAVARLPSPELDPGPCLFLQPCDPRGDRWVLNKIFEGTGRFTSRYLHAMPPAVAAATAQHLAERGEAVRGHRGVALLDLYAPQADSLNVHPRQTPALLALPGERLDPGTAGHVVPVHTLRIRRSDGGALSLVDPAGRVLVPVHLGGTAIMFTPPLVRFLALLGPSEVDQRPFPRTSRVVAGATVWERSTLGRVVVARRRWRVPVGELASTLERVGLSAAGFAAIERWRRHYHLPRHVFAVERVAHPAGTALKPQYVDLGSPLFGLLVAAIAQAAGDSLTLVEALPGPGDHPCDAGGIPRAAEVQVDALSFVRRSDDDGSRGSQ